jgi:hypothetical protein
MAFIERAELLLSTFPDQLLFALLWILQTRKLTPEETRSLMDDAGPP